jgi:hypothetical protein
VLLAPVLAACGQEPEAPSQAVGYCPGTDPEHPDRTRVEIELRQHGEVVGTASVGVGAGAALRVPLGVVEVYADGEHVGTAGSDDEPLETPAPTDITYLTSGEGCADTMIAPPPGPPID